MALRRLNKRCSHTLTKNSRLQSISQGGVKNNGKEKKLQANTGRSKYT